MTENLPSFDELSNIRNELTGMVGGMVEENRIDRKRLEDTIFELITMGYVYGIEVAGLDLETDIPVRRERMDAVAWKRTAGENFSDRIRTHLEEYNANVETDPEAVRKLVDQLATVAETETHRSINTGAQDGAQDYADSHPKETVFKIWGTMQDERVRSTHEYLEGAIVPLNARFYTWDGDSARFPGDFVLPENNVNCRCLIRTVKQ